LPALLTKENRPLYFPLFLKEARDAFEKGYIVNLLELTKGNVSRAAELAGKYRTDFYNLLKKHHLKSEDFKNR